MNIEKTNCMNCGGPLPKVNEWVKCVYCGTNHHLSANQTISIKKSVNYTERSRKIPDFENLNTKQKALCVGLMLVIPFVLSKYVRKRR